MTRVIPFLLLSVLVASSACAGAEKNAPAPEHVSTTAVTSAPTPSAPRGDTEPVSPGIAVSREIAEKCRLMSADIQQMPKFDFDSDELGPADRYILKDISHCLTTGPLAGREVKLVGHADPRGTEQHNIALGARRANAVARYLKRLGVGGERLQETSRGELDATGVDEATWGKDRRVDVLLAD